jgi:hypothetical protein
MTSVLTGLSQIPRASSGFLAVGASPANNTARFFSEAEFAAGPLASANATVAGTNVYFNTNTNANSALVVAGADTSCRLAQFQAFKDLGKNYNIYVPTDTAGSVQVLSAVFTKVRRIGAAAGAADWEGDNGSVGYICTWSAQQTNAAGVVSTEAPICIVARTGFGHAF